MVNGKKRTDRKSQSVRSILNRNVKNENVQTEAAGKEHEQEKQSSRVTDMSWAAKYLDDDWENKYAVRGGYDTKANADSGSVGNSEPVSVDMMSQTQEFKPVNSDESGDDMKIRDAVTGNTIISSDEFRSAIDKEAEHTESFKIRDAFTDKTIALASDIRDHQEVKDAAMAADLDEDMKDIENIEPIVTVRTKLATESRGQLEELKNHLIME